MAPFLGAVVVIVVAWTALSWWLANATLLPMPGTVLATSAALITSGQLFVHAGPSIGRIILAWAVAAALRRHRIGGEITRTHGG